VSGSEMRLKGLLEMSQILPQSLKERAEKISPERCGTGDLLLPNFTGSGSMKSIGDLSGNTPGTV